MIEPDGKEHVCERCGECCINGGPFLFLDDLKLFEDKILRPGDVYTLRKGELEFDIVNEEIEELPIEMIRMKEVAGTKYCVFYDTTAEACTIYENRPKQCVNYECWFPRKLFGIMGDDRLSRKELFKRIPSLIEVIEEHESKCSYEKIQKLVEQIHGGSEDAANELLDILAYDTEIRAFVAEKLNLSEEDVQVMFGRPLMLTIKMFGYEVEQDPDGAYCLKVREKPAEEEK